VFDAIQFWWVVIGGELDEVLFDAVQLETTRRDQPEVGQVDVMPVGKNVVEVGVEVDEAL